MSEAKGQKGLDTEEYLRYDTDILQYGELRYRTIVGEQKRIGNGEERELRLIRELPEIQIKYLNMLGDGIPWREACDLLGISRATPFLWAEEAEDDGIYNQCLELVKMIEADELESIVWDEARNSKKATLLKMFALKARKDEYKDNAPPAAQTETVINVSIGDQPYDVSANYRVIETEGEEIDDGKG